MNEQLWARVFSEEDAQRIRATLRRLARHDISRFVLTGGIAIEMNLMENGGYAERRVLHDLDFIVDSFACVPKSLGGDFLMRHVHPEDPPGKTLVQCVDPEAGVRVDVFRAYGETLQRATEIKTEIGPMKMIGLEDLAARNGRLCWDLTEGKSLAPKYARDFLRLLRQVRVGAMDGVWRDHRKPHFPWSFREAAEEIEQAIQRRAELLVPVDYSKNQDEVCVRCTGQAGMPLAEPGKILALLGYC